MRHHSSQLDSDSFMGLWAQGAHMLCAGEGYARVWAHWLRLCAYAGLGGAG